MSTDNPLKIVAIDDDENMREILNVLLVQVMGCQDIAIFSDSHNLVQRINALSFQPEIILLDLVVQPLDGHQILQLLRPLPALEATRFVALTAKVMNDDITKMKASGFDGLIGKPIIRQVFPKLLENIANGGSIWYVA